MGELLIPTSLHPYVPTSLANEAPGGLGKPPGQKGWGRGCVRCETVRSLRNHEEQVATSGRPGGWLTGTVVIFRSRTVWNGRRGKVIPVTLARFRYLQVMREGTATIPGRGSVLYRPAP